MCLWQPDSTHVGDWRGCWSMLMTQRLLNQYVGIWSQSELTQQTILWWTNKAPSSLTCRHIISCLMMKGRRWQSDVNPFVSVLNCENVIVTVQWSIIVTFKWFYWISYEIRLFCVHYHSAYSGADCHLCFWSTLVFYLIKQQPRQKAINCDCDLLLSFCLLLILHPIIICL